MCIIVNYYSSRSIFEKILFVSVLIFCFWGCDRVRTTRQQIVLSVHTQQSAPITSVTVRVKESWESWQKRLPAQNQASFRDYHYNTWENEYEWLVGVTDEEGKVVLEEINSIVGETWGNTPPERSDLITDQTYCVELQSGETTEKLLIEMKKGNSIEGKHFSIKVDDISSPEYVNE